MNEQTKTMNCEDYIEAIAADPAETFAGGAEHAEVCPTCRAERDSLRKLDARIASALTISVPDLRVPELPEITPADNVVMLAPRRRVSTPAWFGIAAGFALAAYFGLVLLNANAPELSLSEQVIAHLDHEEGSRVVTQVAVS